MSETFLSSVQNAPEARSAEDVLRQWRERLLKYILRGASVAGILALVASVLGDIQAQDWLNIAVTSTAWIILVAVSFLRLPFRVRAGVLILLLYAMSMNSLLTSGIRGESRMFIIIFIVLTLMLLGLRAGQAAIGLSFLSIAVVAWAVLTQRFTLTEPYDQLALASWLTGSLTMMLTIILLVLGVVLLQREFISAHKRAELVMDDLVRGREQLEERVTERTRDLTLAADVGRSVSQLHDLGRLLPNAVELIRSQFSLYYAQIYLMDNTGRTLTLRAGTGGVGAELLRRGHRLAVGPGSINGVAAGEREAVIVADTATNPTFRPNPLLPETRSEMAVPLLIGERVVGVLDLQSRHPGALSDENLSVFETLAGQLAIALDNAALFVETEQARQVVEEQSRRLTRSGWQEFLNGLQRSERIGYRYEQNSLAPFNSPLPETQPENTVKTSILVTGTPVGTIQLERSADQPWQSEEVELVNSVVGQASRQLDNLRLLAQAEHYQSQAESAVGRLTREGWKEYLKTKIENSGYLYDQVHVKPLATAGAAEVDGEAAAADHPIETVVQPLRIGAANVGEVAFEGIGALDAASNKLVAEVADVLSGHIEGLRLTEQTQKALIQTEDLYSSSAQVVRSSSIEDVLRAVIETTSLSRFDQGSIIFFDRPWVDKMPETGIVAGTWDRLGREATVPVGTATPLRQTPLAHMIRRDEPVVIPDVLVDLRLDNTFRYQLQSTGRSLVVYPLVAGDTCFGYLSVTASQPVYLAEDEIRPIQTLVSQAATVIQSIRLLQEAQTRAQREQALRQITTAVRSSTNADTILRTATRELGVALGRKVKVQLGGAPKSSEA